MLSNADQQNDSLNRTLLRTLILQEEIYKIENGHLSKEQTQDCLGKIIFLLLFIGIPVAQFYVDVGDHLLRLKSASAYCHERRKTLFLVHLIIKTYVSALNQ